MAIIQRVVLTFLALIAISISGVNEVSAQQISEVQPHIVGAVPRTNSPKAETCRTDIFGNVNCSGNVGGSRTSNTCRTDIFGNVNCSGNVGGSRTSKTCRKDIFGNVTCS